MNRVIDLNKSICSLIELLGGKGIPIILDQKNSEQQKTTEATNSAIQTTEDDDHETEQEKVQETTVDNAVNENSGDEISNLEKDNGLNNQADEKTASHSTAESQEFINNPADQSSSTIEGSGELEQLSTAGENIVTEAAGQDTDGILVNNDDQDNFAACDEEEPDEDVGLEATQKSEHSEESQQKEDQAQVIEVIPSQETLTRKLETIDENDDGKLDFEKVAYVDHKLTPTFIFLFSGRKPLTHCQQRR